MCLHSRRNNDATCLHSVWLNATFQHQPRHGQLGRQSAPPPACQVSGTAWLYRRAQAWLPTRGAPKVYVCTLIRYSGGEWGGVNRRPERGALPAGAWHAKHAPRIHSVLTSAVCRGQHGALTPHQYNVPPSPAQGQRFLMSNAHSEASAPPREWLGGIGGRGTEVMKSKAGLRQGNKVWLCGAAWTGRLVPRLQGS